jgi:hypothetical protein
MAERLEYDGELLHWRSPGDGRPEASYRATSGLTGHQYTSEQCVPEAGPVPPGHYQLLLRVDRNGAQDDGTNQCSLRPSTAIQTIPRGPAAGPCEPYWANWGRHRVRFEPADSVTRHACHPPRGGFYLHDSTKGYSHGCIEVETSFFTRLYVYVPLAMHQYLPLRVNYAYAETNGGTRVP